eukprot:scaffold161335_cov38-Prasinocladus_malaysianus.AAC.1
MSTSALCHHHFANLCLTSSLIVVVMWVDLVLGADVPPAAGREVADILDESHDAFVAVHEVEGVGAGRDVEQAAVVAVFVGSVDGNVALGVVVLGGDVALVAAHLANLPAQ